MINIAKLLKDAPNGMKLYSPLLGEVKFDCVKGFDECIIVTRGGKEHRFTKSGKYIIDITISAECLLFPSKDCRTWEGWKLPVEPKFKFKVGDWIVQNDNGTVSQITKTINGKDEYGEYRAYEHTNGYFAACFENEYHLWTIQDAKDGDVLVNQNGEMPFVFKSCKSNHIYCHCAYTNHKDIFFEKFLDYGRELHWINLLHEQVQPATKEQRDLFFKRMREAGYQWDIDKKELRKIQLHYDIANFKPKQWVLVRDDDEWEWALTRFSYLSNGSASLFVCINGASFQQCIPFEGNEHLLGTTDMCDEMYINW